MVVTCSLLLGPLCSPEGNGSCSGSVQFSVLLFLHSLLRFPGGLSVVIEREGRSGKKIDKLMLPFPYQKDRRRTAHQRSELLLHLKESWERGAYLMHLPTGDNSDRTLLWSML